MHRSSKEGQKRENGGCGNNWRSSVAAPEAGRSFLALYFAAAFSFRLLNFRAQCREREEANVLAGSGKDKKFDRSRH